MNNAAQRQMSLADRAWAYYQELLEPCAVVNYTHITYMALVRDFGEKAVDEVMRPLFELDRERTKMHEWRYISNAYAGFGLEPSLTHPSMPEGMPYLSATFVPQRDLPGQTSHVEVEPSGDNVFDVTEQIIRMGKEKALALEDNTLESDALRDTVHASDWVRNWDGHFTARIPETKDIVELFDFIEKKMAPTKPMTPSRANDDEGPSPNLLARAEPMHDTYSKVW